MKKMISTLSLLCFFCTAQNAMAEAIKPTNPQDIYSVGTVSTVPTTKVSLKPGLYVIGDEDHKAFGTTYLIVDSYVNDDQKVLALMISMSNLNGRQQGVGRFYIGKAIKNGGSFMLAPIFIDANGNLANEAEISTKAEVLEISVRGDAGSVRYPYLVQGHNGALNGQLLGMRSTSQTAPSLSPWPKNNIYQSTTRSGGIVVSGDTVAIHDGYSMDQRFQLLPVNGELGKVAELVNTSLDTMSETMISDSDVKKLAFFMVNKSNKEIFIIATPTMRPGQYLFDFYSQEGKTFMDWFRPGSL